MQATAKDLRFHSKELLNTVKRGEEVVITYRGKPCAKLVPIEEEKKTSPETNELFGIWNDNAQAENVENYIRTVRKGRFNAN
ncbi:type II toxin-antitoxin system Phd/YefM family antitoxin [Desulfurivibrio dismutans]|uniref:type II toxin-antitoxin system Phd/YefM family antitoxin n=1 Tax=Desulfurivibrio dismutans TaxID=1398908 RepID=UPI003D649C51